jgi:hypothetical protein
MADRHEFQTQQSQRQEQRSRIQAKNQQEGQEVWDLEHRLDMWVGKCPLCYIQQCQGLEVDIQHPFDKCPDELHGLVAEEVEVLKGIKYKRFASCYDCGVAQKICMRWEEIREGNISFKRVKNGVCQYGGIVRAVVAAMMIVGPLEVVEENVYRGMKVEGIWGSNEKLNEEEVKQVKTGMLRWFGEKVNWASMEASVLLQVLYRLTVGLEEWRRRSKCK